MLMQDSYTTIIPRVFVFDNPINAIASLKSLHESQKTL
jgi:hypothetical protein